MNFHMMAASVSRRPALRGVVGLTVFGLGCILILSSNAATLGAPGATRRPAGGRAAQVPFSNAPLDTPTATPTQTPPPVCGPFWRLVSSPNVSAYNLTTSIMAISANDLWVVGFSQSGASLLTLTEHWNGTQWSVVASPNVGTSFNLLEGVAGIASNDVWAVGDYTNGSTYQTLIEHWNGTAWAVVASPNQGSGSNNLYGVAEVAANDVWAVGSYANGSATQTLVEHWNGTTWSIVPSLNAGVGNNVLDDVTALAANDVWAVGAAAPQSLIEHWNGTAWSTVASTNVGGSSNTLHGLTALNANNIWAVGSYSNGGSLQSLIEHWNGAIWSTVASANGPPGDTDLRGVAAVTDGDIWAVGFTGATSPQWAPYSEHWNGTTWTTQPMPDNTAVAHNSTPWDVVAVGPNNLWMAGDDSQTLIEHYSDPCATGSVTPTGTPGPATSTPTATRTATATPTRTPGPSATPCSISFADVTPSDYFYTPVLYLACHGVISGYSDGTFRPYDNTTRGQVAKMATLAFGLPITTPAAGGFTFADVPVGSTFFAYVETVAARGIVGGYACGGTNPQTGRAESCDSGSRPYYRPGNFVTRGQFSKITVVTAMQTRGWTLINPPTASFSDVPVGSTFYQYVETAACHGIVGGYSDGTFRPADNATRGQISKIVYYALGSGAACGPAATPSAAR